MFLHKTLKNISCKEYCNINNLKYTTIKESHPQTVYIPSYEDKSMESKSIEVMFPEIYVAELNNMNLIGGNYIVFDENDYCIYDLPFMDNENKYDLRCNETLDVNKDNTFTRFVNSSEIIDEGIMLVAGACHNYSHFQLEVASKLCLINEIDEYKSLPIIVDEICLLIPQFKEELLILNKQGRTIIPVKRSLSYKVKKMIYISDLGTYPCNIKPNFLLNYNDVVINELGIKLLNKNLSIKNNIYKKLFISRSKSPHSRLQNQPAVENIFKSFGYEIIFPGEMSFQDQLRIFSEAEYIAGESGSGLTNIIFANKNAKIIFIQPKNIQSPWYSNIAGILNLKNYFIDGQLVGYSPLPYYQRGFIVNEQNLVNFLSGLT